MRSRREAMVLAPGAAGSLGVQRFPARGDALPAVDEHVVAGETREELLHGQRLVALPAKEPHGVQHFGLAYVLGAYVAAGYRGAVDMLTRTGHDSDFAPDASVYPVERDPVTGGRKLEELAFEIVSEQAMKVPTDKARELSRRGVRRVFCLVLKKRQVLEWSAVRGQWGAVPGEAIDDRCLIRPLPVRALLDAFGADDAVASALLAKENPVLQAALTHAKQQGKLDAEIQSKAEEDRLLQAALAQEGHQREIQSKAESVLLVLQARQISICAEEQERIRSCREIPLLERWIGKAATVQSGEDLFEER